MIESHEMQDGSMEVVDVNRIFNNVIAKVISLSIYCAGFHSTTCHPYGITSRVMVPSIVFFGKITLTIVGSTEFATLDHERFI